MLRPSCLAEILPLFLYEYFADTALEDAEGASPFLYYLDDGLSSTEASSSLSTPLIISSERLSGEFFNESSKSYSGDLKVLVWLSRFFFFFSIILST